MTDTGDSHRSPTWEVVAVFEDRDGGGGFAYTVGLQERGLPEVHMWARPPDGDDPGHDWRFSERDMMIILNDVAWRLIDGRVAAGESWEEKYDAGLVTARFQLEPAGDADAVEAYQAAPALVHPLRWSLHRPSEGPLAPLSREHRDLALDEYLAMVDWLAPRADALEGWELPEQPSWDSEQRWGPRTANVLAHAAYIRAFGADEMIGLVNLVLALDFRHMTTYPQVVALAAARDVGRTSRVQCLVEDAVALVSKLGADWGQEPWRAALRWLNEDDPEPFPEDRLRDMVARVIASHLVTVAVEDRLGVDEVLPGLAPVVSSARRRGDAPDSRWIASSHVIDHIIRIVGDSGPYAVVLAAQAWGTVEDEPMRDLQVDLMLLGLRSSAMFPRFEEVIPADHLESLHVAARARGVSEWMVQDWLTTLATVLTHRVELDEATVGAVLECGAPHMPGLESLVNSPLSDR